MVFSWDLTQCQKWDSASCLPLNIWCISSFCRPLQIWLAAHLSRACCHIFPCCNLKMMQNGSKPKGKYLIIVLQTIKWWEISRDSSSQIILWLSGGGESWGGDGTVTDCLYDIAAGCLSVTQLSAVQHQIPVSDPCDYSEINSSTAIKLDPHNHTLTPAKAGHTRRKDSTCTRCKHTHSDA